MWKGRQGTYYYKRERKGKFLMKIFKTIMTIIGVVLGAYVGVWVLFFQGVADSLLITVAALRGAEIVNYDLAWALLKFFFGIPVGFIIGFVFYFVGNIPELFKK